MVHVVNCTCKNGSEDLKVREHSLEEKGQECRESGERRGESREEKGERREGVKSLDKNTLASNCH